MDAVQAVVILQGQPVQAAELAAFGERLFRDAFTAENRAADLEAYVKNAYGKRQQTAELNDPQITTLLAHVDGQLAGFAQVRPGKTPAFVDGSAPTELWRFYVDRPFQGRGVARALMNAVFDVARARGADTMWLGVWERNPRAQAFYRKCGFIDVGQQEFQLGADSQTDLVMVRRL